MVTIIQMGAGQGSQGQGLSSWIDKLLPVAVIGVIGYILYSLLVGGSSKDASSTGTATPAQAIAAALTPTAWTSSGNQKGAVVVSPSGFAQTLVQTFTGKGTTQPENVMSGASWTRYALPAKEVPAWQPPGLIALQSGRDQPISGQIAEYNPVTGNAWGGALATVKELYTGYLGTDCPSIYGKSGYEQCIADQGWRAQFA